MVTYASTITSCCVSLKWESGIALLHHARSSSLSPSLSCYNAVLGACRRSLDSWTVAISLLSDLHMCTLGSSDVTCESVMTMLAAQSQWAQVSLLLDDMRGRAVTPNARTLSLAVDCMSKFFGHETASAIV